jgi:peptidoglycan/LPS O-acetylase OafA/YrhL
LINIKQNFRKDIQGLRGIAVIAVILYHAEIYFFGKQIFSGGYLGVDIFFVISGFLITKIVINNSQKNKLSFLQFMNSRIRRIMPLLLIVIAITSILSWKYLLPSVFYDFSKSQLSSILFFSNYFFFLSSLNYYDFSVLLKPLVHTWSLSLELQMYLLLFFFLSIILKVFKKKIIILIFISLIFSFLITLLTTLYDASLSFYSFHSRIWEFLVGSLAFTLLGKFRNISWSKFLSLSGIILIISSLFLFGKNTNHPSYLTIFPVLGIFLIIIFNQGQTITSFILKNKLTIYLGQISYSLYLWHYPIFAIFRNLNLLGGNFLHQLLIIFSLFILSDLSFRFIEQPFRDRIKINNKICYITLSSLFLINFFFSLHILNQYDLKKNISLSNNEYLVKDYNLDNKFLIDKKNIYLKNLKKKLSETDKVYKKNILILGDSMSLDVFNILTKNKEISKNFNISHYYLLNGCLEKGNLSQDYSCEKNEDNYLDINSKIKNSADIIFINYLYNAPWNRNYLKNIDLFIKKNQDQNKIFIIVSDRYRFPFNINYSILDEFILKKKFLPNTKELKNIENLYYLYKSKDTDTINNHLKSLSNNNKVLFFSFSSAQCDSLKRTCKALNSLDDKIYLDNVSHMSLSSYILFEKELSKFLKNIF